MDRALRILMASLTAILLFAGSNGLRALHLATEHGATAHGATEHGEAEHRSESCASHSGDQHLDCAEQSQHAEHAGHAHHTGDADPDHPCATCELLFGLVALNGATIPLPAFHALVAVVEPAAPAPIAAPLPPRLVSARPPPPC